MKGQCLCGSVAFEFEGPLSNFQICHCTRCKRATGGPFSAEVRVPTEGFRWVRGENLISSFDAPILRDPPAFRKSFCVRCGSPVPDIFGEQAIIATGLIEDAFAARPVEHIWFGKKANWLNFAELDALPKQASEPGL